MTALIEAMTLPRILSAGSRGLLLDVAQGGFNATLQHRVLNLSRMLKSHPAVEQAVPGMNNLLLVLKTEFVDLCAMEIELFEAWGECEADTLPGRIIEVPVIYGGEQGEDLSRVAELAGLTPAQLVEIHSGADYLVACLGAMPGFPYLGGLDSRLHTARRPIPRIRVQQGSVIIGGAQAAVMPLTGPSGWHIIGHTPLRLFDPAKSSPAYLQPGDRVRFMVEGVHL